MKWKLQQPRQPTPEPENLEKEKPPSILYVNCYETLSNFTKAYKYAREVKEAPKALVATYDFF